MQHHRFQLDVESGLYVEKYIQYILNVKDMQTRKLFTLELIEYQWKHAVLYTHTCLLHPLKPCISTGMPDCRHN